jgi:putative MFS transporter
VNDRGANGEPGQRLTRYHILLLALVGVATLYDGFDASMLSLAAPDVCHTLGISQSEWGTRYMLTRLGMVGSFFFLLFADQFGRRALLLFTVGGFALCTGATAFVSTANEFTFLQAAARLFLTAQYGLAVIIAGEEFPTHLRSRAITVLTSLSTVGVVVMAKVQPFFLLLEGSEGNWLHDATLGLVAQGFAGLGREFDGAHWRALYLFGTLPLLLLPFLRLGIRETQRFAAVAATKRAEGWGDILAARWRDAKSVWAPRYRQRVLVVTLLWNCVHMVTAPSVAFWAIYVRGDLVGMTPAQVGNVLMWAYIAGAFGHLAAGQLIERIGRKLTCSAFYAVAAVCIVALFHTTTVFGQYFWHITTVFFFNAAIGATHVYVSELFPTELRATGYGWTTNLFGRMMELGAPFLIGQLIPVLGISWAVTLGGFGPILGAALVLKFAPETRGLSLEEIQERLDAERTRVASPS